MQFFICYLLTCTLKTEYRNAKTSRKWEYIGTFSGAKTIDFSLYDEICLVIADPTSTVHVSVLLPVLELTEKYRGFRSTGYWDSTHYNTAQWSISVNGIAESQYQKSGTVLTDAPYHLYVKQ